MIAAFPGPWWIKSMSASRTSFTVTVALTAPFTFRSLAEGNATLDASARLVAAAPELLAACRLALREHGQSVLFSDAALAALEGAIASAEVHEDGDLTCPDCHGDGGAFLVGVLSGVVLFTAPMVRGDGPPVEPARGTVERRIHLTMDSRWDSDRRRAFVCREEAR